MNEDEKSKKQIYKKWWFWAIIIIVVIVIGSQGSKQKNYSNSSSNNNFNEVTIKKEKAEVKLIDFSTMDRETIKKWGDTNKVNINVIDQYSNNVAKGLFINQSVKADTIIHEDDNITVNYSLGKEPTNEEKNALKKAEQYSDTMYMSKKGIYNQLISKYGENFSNEAAQYAIDNIEADWNKNALEKAKNYQQTMNMSKNRIYDQLISEYGEKFTKSEAQYAINHLDD
jgi:hypothetical protein